MLNVVEVHSVAITLNKKRVKGSEIFGIVYAADQFGTVEIYNESKESCKPILADDTLYLTGPTRPISCGDLVFYVDLKDKETELEVSNGLFFVPNVPSEHWFEKPMSIAFPGDYGRATLFATMFTYAVEVTVEVKLVIDANCPPSKRAKLSGVGDNSKYIHGTLYAKGRGQERVYHRTTLFSRSADDPQRLVDPNMIPSRSADGPEESVDPNVIPLSRHVIVVSMNSSIIFEADLWDGSKVQVAKGTVQFDDLNTHWRPIYLQEDGEIKGEEGVSIVLKVTWNSDRKCRVCPAPAPVCLSDRMN